MKSTTPTIPRTSDGPSENIFRSPRIPFVPAIREPFSLPEQQITLSPPPPAPGKPPAFNWLGALLPPAVIIIVMLLISQFSGKAGSFVYPSMLTSLAFPLANLGNLYFQRKNYQKQLEKRRLDYQKILSQEKLQLDALCTEQRRILQQEYPSAEDIISIALSGGKKRRLWWRRPKDSDFLSLRIGIAHGVPSFRIAPPTLADPYEPLKTFPYQLITNYEKIPNLPFLIDLKAVGSLGIVSKDEESLYQVIRRLVLDLCVHQSPGDFQLVLICDSSQNFRQWEWLKWLPHSKALETEKHAKTIAFSLASVDECVQGLINTYDLRFKALNDRVHTIQNLPHILAIFDDRQNVRQNPALTKLIENGHLAGIYTIFIGDKNLPRVHAQLEVSKQGNFIYMETWERGQKTRGKLEGIGFSEMNHCARNLSRLEPLGTKLMISLPESIRISQLLKEHVLTEDAIKENWQKKQIRSDRELLQFPIGVQVTREGLESININLLPAEKGGEDAYHTILIGTTGSGKSEFMKSFVLAAAHKYAPEELSFFLMDFKGGAAFNSFTGLTHVAGVVTNLMKPEWVRRSLIALQGEIARRQGLFHADGVQNIWQYNQKKKDYLPHLVLLLDEFTKGLNDFPELKEILDLLVRQGRSLGMYLILANQDVNATVEKLLNNVGWRIALKVAQQSEMHIIERALQPTRRAGRGYLRSSNGEITEFQAAYAGLLTFTEIAQATKEYKIFEVSAEGEFKELVVNAHYRHEVSDAPPVREEETLINLYQQVAHELNNPPIHQIYLPPLPEIINLEGLLESAPCYRQFVNSTWTQPSDMLTHLKVPIGFLDLPETHSQKPLWIDFGARDGHLLIAGVPNSGKSVGLATILLSLALTHTPQETQFYVLEFGAGSLRELAKLPHVGAVVQVQEKERLNRLCKFLDEEITRRKLVKMSDQELYPNNDTTISKKAEIFLVINNFAALREKYPDKVEQIFSIAQDGNANGVHLLITVTRGGDLPPKLSANIARRIVLEMPNRDEYIDLIRQKVSGLSGRMKGRGYWVDDFVAECQIAQTPIQDREVVDPILIEKIHTAWIEPSAPRIQILEKSISLSTLHNNMKQVDGRNFTLPVGVDYENLGLVNIELPNEIRQWTIIGPKHSGKSNFLVSIAKSFLKNVPKHWELLIFTFRPSPLQQLSVQEKQVRLCSTNNDMEDTCKEIEERLRKAPTKQLLWLIDDLGAIFEPGRESIMSLMNLIGNQLTVRDDVMMMASAHLDEIRTRKTNHGLIKLLGQTQTGLCFGPDFNMLDWLGVTSSKVSEYLRMDFPTGRGFYVKKGSPIFLQTPFIDIPKY